MTYEISIKKVERLQVFNTNYVKVGEDDDGEAKYDYKREETTEDVERTVYIQRTEELDLKAVIDAVNKETK